MKVIQINGFRGILMATFVAACLFVGFVVFPGDVIMHLWNKYLVALAGFPVVNLFQGILLWGICAVSYYIVVKGNLPLAFGAPDNLSDAELNMIMKQARISYDMRRMNTMMKQADIFTKQKTEDKKAAITPPMNEKTQKDENIDKINNVK